MAVGRHDDDDSDLFQKDICKGMGDAGIGAGDDGGGHAGDGSRLIRLGVGLAGGWDAGMVMNPPELVAAKWGVAVR